MITFNRDNDKSLLSCKTINNSHRNYLQLTLTIITKSTHTFEILLL